MSIQRHIAFRGAEGDPGSKGVIGYGQGHGNSIEFFLIESQFSCWLAVDT